MTDNTKKHILFICAMNLGRSPTGMDLVNSIKDGYESKSCGVYQGATVEVTRELLDWADTIFVMEDYMKNWLVKYTNPDKIIVLHIPDRYGYADPILINILRSKLLSYGIDATCVEFQPSRKLWAKNLDDWSWEDDWEAIFPRK